ncbi:BRCA1-A complex subunit RAP80 isoform X4 [Gadus chalcogrammus]|uniref:BRCA1-A complex subunit RAP80 isoform X4 n=1 Tax=Gadus chalcogrammus TaxID=1042646 RepID=UPI0024C3EEC6|nr:BRCA1-A complex subunit RAP80 isoform X4 [Gadus chalcogrammus]
MSPRKQVIKTSSALSSGGDGDCVEADDTDEEMFQEELPHSSTSLSRRRERVVKAKPKELSEEEMMDLALRLSEQEASIAAAKRQQEEEAMTEALKESMFSQTQPCASPPSQRYHGNTDPSPKLPSRRQLAYPATVPKNVSLAEELSVNNNPRGAGNLKHNMRKRKREDGVPVLERADLPQTQKICSQSSTLEPLCSQTNGLNHKDAESESTSRDHVGKPTTAALAGKEKPTKKDEESIPEIMKMTSDMTLHWSDSEEDLEQSEGSPSPVFPEERRPRQAEPPTCSPEHSGSAPSATSSHSPKRLRLNPVPAVVFLEAAGSDTSTSCPRVPQSGPGPSHPQEPSSRVPAPPLGPGGEPLVQYYWGVPFCPQGLDPDRYTQVILAQMEVYEKSLKNAQRGLLRKAEWGAGITPKPEEPLEDSPELIPTISLRRPGLRSRRRAAGVKPSEEEEEDEDEDEGGREEDVKRKGVEPVEEAEEDLDVVGCDMCPETQLSGDETQVLEVGTDAADETQPDSPSLLQIQSLPRSWEGEGEGEEEEEETHPQDPNKKEEEAEEDAGGDCEQPAVMSPSREQAPLSGKEEEEEETQGAVGVEERKEAGPEAGLEAASSVDCPMCQSAFPVSEIEMHAAFCDGEQEVVESPVEDSPGSHRPSKRRALKSLATEDRGDGDPSGHAPAPQGRERCYVCHKSVPLAEYARHTESCIQRQRAHTASPKGDLLSALENTERRHPGGPSVSKLPTAVIDLSNSNDDDDDESEEGGSGQPSTFKVSDSPIRAFTSISEASDCLVDFRRQLAPREPSQRSRGRRGGRGGGGRGGGGGFKRKFKRR